MAKEKHVKAAGKAAGASGRVKKVGCGPTFLTRFVSSQIIGKNRDKFFGRQRPCVGISGSGAEVAAVALFPIGIEERSDAMLDRIRRYVEIFSRILIKRFAGKERAVFI